MTPALPPPEPEDVVLLLPPEPPLPAEEDDLLDPPVLLESAGLLSLALLVLAVVSLLAGFTSAGLLTDESLPEGLLSLAVDDGLSAALDASGLASSTAAFEDGSAAVEVDEGVDVVVDDDDEVET